MGELLRFLRRCAWVIGTVPLLMVAVYVWVDPFMAVSVGRGDVNSPTSVSSCGHPMAGINKGMITLNNYKRYAADHQYNAFILGSSVSVPYRVEYWTKKLCELDPAAVVRPVHFDSSGESVHSLRLKLEYLRRTGADLRHALIVVPPSWIGFTGSKTPPYINMPDIDPDVSTLEYHWMYLKAFYNREFFRSYLMSRIMGRPVKVGTVNAIDTEPWRIDPLTNEETNEVWDDSVRHHSRDFYANRPYFAEPRNIHRLAPAMTDEVRRDLHAIARLLGDCRTDYALVIGPTLYKELPAESDLMVLRQIFGDRLHDMSLSMAPRADVDTCFFDFIHYRYPVACEIMDSVYSK